MPRDLITRTATVDDIDVLITLNAFVQALHAEAHPDRFRESPDLAAVSSWFATAVADPNQRVWLAELDGKEAGYLVLRVIRRSPNPFKFADDFGLIDQISVDPKVRRQGLAHALVEAARQFLRDNGITRMRADHWAFNKRAAAFFSSEGLAPLHVNRDGPVDR